MARRKKPRKRNCRAFLKKFRNNEVRTLNTSCPFCRGGGNIELSPHLLAALDEFVYAWDHPEEYQWFTDADEFMKYLTTGEIE